MGLVISGTVPGRRVEALQMSDLGDASLSAQLEEFVGSLSDAASGLFDENIDPTH